VREVKLLPWMFVRLPEEFGHRQAYESPGGPNPRAARGRYGVFKFWPAPVPGSDGSTPALAGISGKCAGVALAIARYKTPVLSSPQRPARSVARLREPLTLIGIAVRDSLQ
jgi:hypothetical protein